MTLLFFIFAFLIQPANTFIAKVGMDEVRFADFVQRYSDFIISTGSKDNFVVRKAILDNMITEELLLNSDNQKTIRQNQNFINDIQWAKKQTVLAYLKDREIYAKMTVTDVELRQAFQHANEKLTARHLYARTEDEANNLYQLLSIGVDFNLLAKQVFTDSVLRNNGGYLGEFTWGDMDPAFEETAYSLNVGEISHPVKTEHGYSIIKLESRVFHPLLTETQFLQKRSHLERVLKLKKKKLAEQEYVKNIFKPEDVIFDDNNLETLIDGLKKVSTKNAETDKSKNSLVRCATYKGKSYTVKDLMRRFQELPAYHREKISSREYLKAAIQGFILQEKLLVIAHNKKYDALPVVEDAFKKEKEAIFLKYKLQEITAEAKIPDSVLYEHYKTNIHLFSAEEELNVQEIIVAESALADSLKSAVTAGADFGALARRFSLRKWSAMNNGVMGFAPASKFGQLKQAFSASPAGELVGPVKIENYYGLFKVLEKKASEPVAFNLIKARVLASLKSERQPAIVKEYVEKLKKQVNIEINEQLLMQFKVNDFVSQN